MTEAPNVLVAASWSPKSLVMVPTRDIGRLVTCFGFMAWRTAAGNGGRWELRRTHHQSAQPLQRFALPSRSLRDRRTAPAAQCAPPERQTLALLLTQASTSTRQNRPAQARVARRLRKLPGRHHPPKRPSRHADKCGRIRKAEPQRLSADGSSLHGGRLHAPALTDMSRPTMPPAATAACASASSTSSCAKSAPRWPGSRSTSAK